MSTNELAKQIADQLKGAPADYVPSKAKPQRKFQEYKGEVQLYDGKRPIRFTSRDDCGVDGCKKKLIIERVAKTKWLKDESGFGGQLDYDENEIKYFMYCPQHGPSPSAPPEFYAVSK